MSTCISVEFTSGSVKVEREVELPITVRMPSGRRLIVTEAHMGPDGEIHVDDAHYEDGAA